MRHSDRQAEAAAEILEERPPRFWEIDAKDPFGEYMRARRFKKALSIMEQAIGFDPERSILCTCDSAGSLAVLCLERGYKNVISSDISQLACDMAYERDSRLQTKVLDCEKTGLPDNSYDIVAVQDGLHHLSSPVGGLVEMLRIAKKAVIFIEPAKGLAGSVLGSRWEQVKNAENYVFRWSKELIDDVCSSYLLHDFENLSQTFWWHNIHLGRLKKRWLVELAHSTLTALPIGGNQILGVIIKPEKLQ